MPRTRRIQADLAQVILRLSGFLPIEDVSAYTGISVRKIKSIKSFHRKTGKLVPDQGCRSVAKKLGTSEVNFLLGCIARNCDIYLDELQENLFTVHGVRVSLGTLSRTLRRVGVTQKKLTRVAAERSEVKRAAYTAQIGLYSKEQLVFVDESSVDRRTTYRRNGRAFSGQRAFHTAHFVRGKRYSVLPALSLDGILSTKIIEGSFTAQTFGVFIDHLLSQMNPFPERNSVIVMDNCRIHKDPEVLAKIIESGRRYVFLPPYSPDLNPIEEAFSVMKRYLQRNGDTTRLHMSNKDDISVYMDIHKAIWAITPANAVSFFKDCGYF